MPSDLDLVPHIEPEASEDEAPENKKSSDPNDYTDRLGLYTPFDWSPEPFVQLDDHQKNILTEIVRTCARMDTAARRFEVQQVWESRLFERGYQHLEPTRAGGWALPGENTRWGPLAVEDASGLFAMNVFGRDRDIIVGAMTRELPKVAFFPRDLSNPLSVDSAKAANQYKYIFEKNSDLRTLLAQIATLFYTDGRIVAYTRHVLDAQRFGKREEGSEQDIPGTPDACGAELTDLFGSLENKVPIQAQVQRDLQFCQLYDEIDLSTAKAYCPWVADKIEAGGNGIGEVELDRIARINTKLALVGSYVTGDSLERDVSRQRTWIRPSMFFETDIKEDERQWFLDNFPKGCLAVFMGTTFGFCRNESMDEVLSLAHAYPGIGMNRRAIGSGDVTVQKRVNNYFDLLDDFARNTVPRKWYDADTFDVKALQEQDNQPGSSGPFHRPTTVTDPRQLIFVEETPTPQPWLPEFLKWIFTEVGPAITGATTTLYGGPIVPNTGDETFKAQREMALGRIGVPWNSIKSLFACVNLQAVKAAAKARQEKIAGLMPDGTNLMVDPAMLDGDIVCYPEFDSSFPESWTERETRYTEVVANAASNPFYAELLKAPKNLRAIADNIRLSNLEVPGEASSEKQLKELTILKMSGPLPNPQAQALGEALSQVQGEAASGTADPSLPQAQAEIQQQLQGMPPEVSSVPVAQDASENHAVERDTCFEWMNGDEGIRFKNGTAEQQAGFQNVKLHWSEHDAMVQKLSAPPPTKPESVTINFKDMPPDAQTQALMKAGLQTTPQNINENELVKTHRKIAEKVVPRTIPDTIRVVKRTDGNKTPQK